jgi:hypothetical protein
MHHDVGGAYRGIVVGRTELRVETACVEAQPLQHLQEKEGQSKREKE